MASQSVGNQRLANNLNDYYCHFEKQSHTALPLTRSLDIQPRICKEDVCQLFHKQKIREALGPDYGHVHTAH